VKHLGDLLFLFVVTLVSRSIPFDPHHQDGPITDSGNLNRVHLDLVFQDDQSEVLNPFLMELTLLWAEK